MSKKMEYTNGSITIVWQLDLCQHSGRCVEQLPEVYNPIARPWIKMERATTEELQKQISNCRSGALSYYRNQV